MGNKKRGNILDIGCGSGSLIFKIKENFNTLYGIDISPSRIKEAQKQATKKFSKYKIYFSVADVNEGIPFSDNMFDAVTCVATLEHLFDPYFVIGEIERVLKEGGLLVLEVPNIAYLKYRIQLLFGRLPVTSSPYN